jgi:GT2 family glycosyltransferase
MDLSIILVSYNVKTYLLGCLDSIYRTTSGIAFEVVVIDNASTDGSVEAIQHSFPQVNLIRNPSNSGLAAAMAQGVSASTGRYVLYLNPDTEILDGTLAGMLRFADAAPDAAGFSCRLLNRDRSLQHSCFRFPNLRMAFYGFFPSVPMDSVANGRYPPECYDTVFEPEHVLGAFLMVRRSAIEEVGGWDARFFMYFEETDFCYRLTQSGHAIRYCPDFSVIHYGGRSTSQIQEEMSVEFYRSQARFYRKNYGLVKVVALKAIVMLGLAFWAARSSASFVRGRIGGALLRTRLVNYVRILLM